MMGCGHRRRFLHHGKGPPSCASTHEWEARSAPVISGGGSDTVNAHGVDVHICHGETGTRRASGFLLTNVEGGNSLAWGEYEVIPCVRETVNASARIRVPPLLLASTVSVPFFGYPWSPSIARTDSEARAASIPLFWIV